MLLSSTLFPFLATLVGTNKAVNALILRDRHHQPIPLLVSLGKARIKSLFSSSTSTFITENNELVEELHEFNPLGPPRYLASLRVGESYKIPILDDRDLTIARLSRNPDIFLVPNLIVQTECLINAAKDQGLKAAGTRKSKANTVRTHSYLTWLGHSNDNEDGALKDKYGSYRGLVQSITDLCNSLFVHESLQIQHGLHSKEDQHHQDQQSVYVTAEDMQIAKYNSGGCFHLHHDGLNRFLTVLTYLNGVGGTYFPLAQTIQMRDNNNHHDFLSPPKLFMNDDGSLSSKGYVVGKDGLLIVGKEGKTAYLDDNEDSILEDSSAIVRIQAGDAVVFYNYNLLMEDTNVSDGHDPEQWGDAGHNKEWRAVHAALAVPQEKWIATNWFRSDVLTGPFAHLHRESLLVSVDTDDRQ